MTIVIIMSSHTVLWLWYCISHTVLWLWYCISHTVLWFWYCIITATLSVSVWKVHIKGMINCYGLQYIARSISNRKAVTQVRQHVTIQHVTLYSSPVNGVYNSNMAEPSHTWQIQTIIMKGIKVLTLGAGR